MNCKRLIWAVVAIVCGLPPLYKPALAYDSDLAIAEWFEKFSLPAPAKFNIIVCHGFGCVFRTPVAMNEADRVTIANMVRGATPEAERRGLARAVAWFDKRFGRVTGTTTAKARASGLAGDATQYDCIDRATNTTALLVVLQQWGMLRHHRVEAPAARVFIPIVGAPHNTAVVSERQGGRKWAIDPWTHGFGELPDVMSLDRWLAINR